MTAKTTTLSVKPNGESFVSEYTPNMMEQRLNNGLERVKLVVFSGLLDHHEYLLISELVRLVQQSKRVN